MSRFAPLLAMLALVFAPASLAQTIQYQQSFEDGTGYTTTLTCNDGFNDFFTRTDTTDISDDYQIAGFDGSFIFAAQDIDATECAGDAGEELPLRIEINNIDISDLENLSFAGLFAEDDANNGDEDWDNEGDFVHVKYRIDSDDDGDLMNLVWFEAGPDTSATGFNGSATEDTDFDGIGDGAVLTPTLSEFTASIAGTGSTLDLVILISLDSGDEDIAIDNLRILGDAAGPPPPPPGDNVFCAADGPVAFPAAPGTSGPTSPYPTTVMVSGVTGTVTDVDIYMEDVTHTNPGDMDVFVEHPAGPTVWLFSDQGNGSPALDADLTFDDEAPGQPPIPFSGPVVTGTYIPANVGTTSDDFDAPAPAVPTSVMLSDFDGANPNGTWNLWGDDDATNNTGDFVNWCVILTVEDTPPPNQDPVADNVTDGDSEDIEVGDTFMATYSFSDADTGDVVSVAVSGAPANFTATPTDGNPATVDVTFTPDASQASMSFPVTFTATDGNGGSAEVTVTYNVGDVDPEPTDCDYAFDAISINSLSVPSDGGRLRYKFEIDNSSNASAATVDIWATVEADGDVIYVRDPRTPTVPAGAVYRAGYNQRIPGFVPDGTYGYTIFAGDFDEDSPMDSEVCGSESFVITKGDDSKANTATVETSEWSDVEIVDVEVVMGQSLETADAPVRVGPNPVRTRATFAFGLAEASEVSLALYDVRGREVATVLSGSLQAGAHTATLDRALPAGVYVWRLTAGERIETGRLTVVR